MRKWGVWLVLLGVGLGCAGRRVETAPPPPVRLRATVDHPTATIYDPITLVVRLDYAPDVVPELPEGLPPVEGLTIADAREEGPLLEDGRRVIVRTYALRAEQPGSYIVPAFTVPYTLPDGTRGEATTARLFIDVASVLGEGDKDLAALRPIRPPVPVPRDYTAYGLMALGVLLGLVLAVLFLRYWRRRRSARIAPAAPPRPPYEVALTALATLERSPLLAQGRVREYVYALSEIFMTYLESAFGIPAVASTSEQLLRYVADSPALPAETRHLVQWFVLETDPIKFAHMPAGAEQAAAWTKRIRRYVETTRPEPELERAA